MASSFDTHDIVLRVLRGKADEPQRLITGGTAKRAFTVGRDADWQLDAADVAAQHLWLAYNGETLYACACRGEMVMIGGVELGAQWLEVPVPIELRVGMARIAVGRQLKNDAETMVPDTGELELIDASTSVDDVVMPAQCAPDEEITRFDETRLRIALRRGPVGPIEDEDTAYSPGEPPKPVVAVSRNTARLTRPAQLAAPAPPVETTLLSPPPQRIAPSPMAVSAALPAMVPSEDAIVASPARSPMPAPAAPAPHAAEKLRAEWQAASTAKKIIAGLLVTISLLLIASIPFTRRLPIHVSTTTLTSGASGNAIAEIFRY